MSVATNWTPRRHDAAQRIRDGKGAWGDPGVAAHASTGVKVVVSAFREHGTRAGLARAESMGLLPGAKCYLAMRTATEEGLAVRVAQLRADLAKNQNEAVRQCLAFLTVRLDDIRAARKEGASAPQAVADKPEIPRTEVHRWVPYVALGISVFALVRSLATAGRK